jgi:pantoate--beta-alanine ligase
LIIFKKRQDLSDFLAKNGKKLGFVPTMGALHKGHISLIETCKKASELTICSIFVNPTQFNNKEDFAKYPITIENDIALLELHGCDVLFLPTFDEIYPEKGKKLLNYDLGYLETILEGKYRPGHFTGVCQVVHILLQMVQPHVLFLGKKDYQQCMVIRKLIEITGLNTHVQVCETFREEDGLAMSSRNMRLSEEERKMAPEIWQQLQYLAKNIKSGDVTTLTSAAAKNLQSKGFVIDYIAIANADTLELVDNWDGTAKIVALVAASINKIRLIDNLILN